MPIMKTARRPLRIVPTVAIGAAVVAIALIGGFATDTTSVWYINLDKPLWQPPAWLFGPVWTVIYLLLALSAITIWHAADGPTRRALITLYGINGALNLAWTFIFFRGHSPLWAGVEILALWITIALLVVRAWPISRAASVMLLPYLIWVGFASVLTWTIARLN